MVQTIEELIIRGWGNNYVYDIDNRLSGWNKTAISENVLKIVKEGAAKSKVLENGIAESLKLFGFATPDYCEPEGKRLIDMFHPFRDVILKVVMTGLKDNESEDISVIQFLIAWFEYDVINRICDNLNKVSVYYPFAKRLEIRTGYDKLHITYQIIAHMQSALNRTNIHRKVNVGNYVGEFHENSCRVFIENVAMKLNNLTTHGNKMLLDSDWKNSKVVLGNRDVASFIHKIKPLTDFKTLDEVNTLLNNFGSLIRK